MGHALQQQVPVGVSVALFEDLVGAHPYAGVSYDEFAETRRESEPNLSPDKLRY